jgi:hypothetical protein
MPSYTRERAMLTTSPVAIVDVGGRDRGRDRQLPRRGVTLQTYPLVGNEPHMAENHRGSLCGNTHYSPWRLPSGGVPWNQHAHDQA